jgi:eukaryotic-like serine/threonine-protein kinase
MVTSDPETAAAPLRTGDPRRLGRYELTGRLGSGGQGAVYLGVAPDGRHVAVKLLHPDQAGNDTARERFVREAQAAMRVARFCTAQVLDADVAGDQPYLVSEHVAGPSLARLVDEQGPITGAALDRLAIGTVTALVAIHQAGIVHRDLKPGNVLIAPDGPRVIDFGVAKDLDGATTSSRIVGTPAYMAPEQLAGETVTPAVDVFAWGAMIAYVATGQAPFGMDTIPLVVNRIVNAEPDLGDLPDPMRSLVADCLIKDPARRPTARQVLLRLLGQEEEAPVAAPVAAPVEEGMLARAATIAATGIASAAGILGAAAIDQSLPPEGADTSPVPPEGTGAGPDPSTGVGTESLPSVGAAFGADPYMDAPTEPGASGGGMALTEPVPYPNGMPAGRPAGTARGPGARRRAIVACTGALVAALAVGGLVSALNDPRHVKPASGSSGASPSTAQPKVGPITNRNAGYGNPEDETGPTSPVTTPPSTQATSTPTGSPTTDPHNPHSPPNQTPHHSASPSTTPTTDPSTEPTHPEPPAPDPDAPPGEGGTTPAQDGGNGGD